jgi:hypothetical protein
MRSHGTHETGRIQTQLTLANSCVTNGTERICVFVRYCANIVLNIIKCLKYHQMHQPRYQALPSCGEDPGISWSRDH